MNKKIYNDDLLQIFEIENPNENNKFKEESDKKEDSKLNLSRFYAMISCIFYCFSDITLKIILQLIPNFNFYQMMSLSFFFFGFCGKFFIIKNNIKTQGY